MGSEMCIRDSSREIEKLQRLQNTAARLTVCTKKSDYITPVLKKLHWPPVNDRITFKLLLLTYKSLNGVAPVYITLPFSSFQ